MTQFFSRRLLLRMAILLLAIAAGFLITENWSGHSADAASTEIQLASHKAIYSYKMKSLQSGARISGIAGEMYYEQDDVCDAWTTDHRFSSTYYYPEQKAVENASHFIAWEAKDGSGMQFNSERDEDGKTVEQLRGAVELRAEGGFLARYIRPSDLTFDLKPDTYFPSKHTQELLRRALKGESFFNAIVFDGTDSEGPIEINSFIGKSATAEEIATIKKALPKEADPQLLTPRAWHVRMAAFSDLDKEEKTPVYTMDMILHDNGVISQVFIDYGEFSIEQVLKTVQLLKPRNCSEKN